METMQSYGFRLFIEQGLRELAIDTPTPVQEKTIPAFLEGNDVIVQSKTGTGKTLAFLLPILQKVKLNSDASQALILTPSRELAQQIHQTIQVFASQDDAVGRDAEGNEIRLRSILLSGGVDTERQFDKLKNAPHIIVATVGRCEEALKRKLISLDSMRWVIVDEADTMVKMGFVEQVGEWLRKSPRAQKGMFSATMPEKIKRIVLPFMKEPLYVQVDDRWTPVSTLELHAFEVTDPEREANFFELARMYNPYLGIVFTNTRVRAEALGSAMAGAGFDCILLHGDLHPRQRKQVVQRFRTGKIQWLVATDLAARGIDVEGISHIFHYDLPQNMEWFTHRNGRTARAGMDGIAVALVAAHEWEKLREFEKQGSMKMNPKKLHAGEIADRIVQPKKTRELIEGRTRPSAEEIKAKRSAANIVKGTKGTKARAAAQKAIVAAKKANNSPRIYRAGQYKPPVDKETKENKPTIQNKPTNRRGADRHNGKVQTVRRPEGKGRPSQK